MSKLNQRKWKYVRARDVVQEKMTRKRKDKIEKKTVQAYKKTTKAKWVKNVSDVTQYQRG